ncbi:MAG: aminopeptidase N [Kangiellaceae bacterium]|nr:aminopeptidase N [Kangiellaceae bacterium]
MHLKSKPQIKYRKDYLPSQYVITTTRLDFELHSGYVIVHSSLSVSLNPLCSETELKPMVLNGVELELQQLTINNKELSQQDFKLEPEQLTIFKVSPSFTIETMVKIFPNKNTSLEGLYLSNGKFCTQCEAEGFRKITYYLDKPEVMAEFFVSIEADKKNFPSLLSNGNLIEKIDIANGRHRVKWHDPFPKPSYLFALVAGDFDCLDDQFTTMSGKSVELKLFVDKGKLNQCQFAMESLINSMKWDEQEFGREYDLNLYMIVAVGDFNMGAMENKGLNVFNTAYVLANKQTATDSDFEGVERVIAHEYFHNWTGNRVTCRDWFQLSLKEGLTVFRDQKFSEDMQSAAVERIDQVKIIRAAQFAEDSGPMAHPIRPDSYIEMNNFYTVTVYNKGAEVIRMMHTLLGKQGFRSGMDLYFKRHDGQAVTCEDFIKAMEDANKIDWQLFRNWYRQAGTPELVVKQTVTDKQQYILSFTQHCPNTPGQTNKEPFLIPVKLGFISLEGFPVEFMLKGQSKRQKETLLILDKSNQTFEIEFDSSIDTSRIIPSLLRDFSAPVKLSFNYTQQQLATLFAYDSNAFNRWDAGQSLMSNLLLSDSEQLSKEEISSISLAIEKVVSDKALDPSLKALAIQLPNLNSLIGEADTIDLDRLFTKYRQLDEHICQSLSSMWLEIYQANHIVTNPTSGNRWLKNTALAYLLEANEEEYTVLALNQQKNADNMTDEVCALRAILRTNHKTRSESTELFFNKWKDEDLVMDKWFSAQVQSDDPSVISEIKHLMQHEKFSITNPNKVRSLIGAFVSGNTMQFHNATGEGYQLLADIILELNLVNPQIGARMAKQFGAWRKFDKKRQALIREHLEHILTIDNLSNDIFEVIDKSLQEP